MKVSAAECRLTDKLTNGASVGGSERPRGREGTRRNFRPEECTVAAEKAKRRPRARPIPNWNVKLYKSIDNSIILLYIIECGAMKPPRKNEVRNMTRILINKLAMSIVKLNRMEEFVKSYEQAKKNGMAQTMDSFKRGYNNELKELLEDFDEIQEHLNVFCEIH